ncbi:unnamed protein product [Caenorhabditis angaria]|uniref:Uncharacterized protein n=1 Tax=Caenorhabditis angaria TaxID=860376 RepID=A0A9P1MW25_9PELO|nr:unnamed protein product [Caenorhabditis angaria]
MEEWKTMFRDIYGRSPTAADIEIAPNNIKSCLKDKSVPIPKSPIKKGPLKRKNIEMKMMEGEQFSPIKKRMNIKMDTPTRKLLSSPSRKTNNFFDDSPARSSPKRVNFSTPGNAKRFDLSDFSPMKTFSAKKVSVTPIKSPQKQPFKRNLSMKKDLEVLLLPTPEKVEPKYDDFDDETTEEVAASKPARKLNPDGNIKKSSKGDQNFQKINLRKKQFVRGKVTAEQKRKFKRKQMFKRK